MLTLAIASLALSTQATGPKIGSLDASNKLAARLIQLFNQGDATGIAALADPDFLRKMPAEQLGGLVRGVHSRGTFSNPELVLDLGEQRHYHLSLAHEGQPDMAILLVLGTGSDGKFFSLGLAPDKPLIPRNRPVGTDNPHRNDTDQSVQAAVDRFAARNNIAGISIGVLRGNRSAFYNYGEVEKGKNTLPTRKTIYEIGSITKTFSGILVGQAVADKKLSLDTDIRKLLPGTYPNLEFDGKPILLRHLVTHASGLPANPPGIPDDGKADAYERYNRTQLLADLASIKLTRPPGAAFSYSNMGAGLIAPILEQAYGTTYEKLLLQFILGPAKMPRTGISIPPDATPYDSAGVKTDPWKVNGIESAGALRSCAEDMLAYARFNFGEKNRAIGLSHQLQSPTGQMPFGLFWQKGNSRLGGAYVSHEGGTGGFTSSILVMPKSRLAVVVLTNSGEIETGPLAYEIALRLLRKPTS